MNALVEEASLRGAHVYVDGRKTERILPVGDESCGDARLVSALMVESGIGREHGYEDGYDIKGFLRVSTREVGICGERMF